MMEVLPAVRLHVRQLQAAFAPSAVVGVIEQVVLTNRVLDFVPPGCFCAHSLAPPPIVDAPRENAAICSDSYSAVAPRVKRELAGNAQGP
jgi:hypothetical protein